MTNPFAIDIPAGPDWVTVVVGTMNASIVILEPSTAYFATYRDDGSIPAPGATDSQRITSLQFDVRYTVPVSVHILCPDADGRVLVYS